MSKKLVAAFAFCLILSFALIISVNATKSDKLSMKEMSLLVGGDNPPNNCQQTAWDYGGGDCYAHRPAGSGGTECQSGWTPCLDTAYCTHRDFTPPKYQINGKYRCPWNPWPSPPNNKCKDRQTGEPYRLDWVCHCHYFVYCGSAHPHPSGCAEECEETTF